MDLFAHAPVPLWLVDFSGVRPLIDHVRSTGFEALCARFRQDRDLMRRCCDEVRIVEANVAAQGIFALSIDELRGPLARFLHEDGLAELGIQIAAIATGHVPFRHDVYMESEEGRRTLDLILSMVDPDDWSRVVAASVDQTERVAAVAALTESEERFRTICEHAPVMIDQFDRQGQVLLWNRECERRLGWTQAEIAAHPDPLALAYPDPKERNRALESILRADGQFREYRVHAKNGEVRAQLWADFRLPSGALISVGHDITDLREAEARERRLEEQMWQTQKLESLGVLAGGIAHDFNNLLVGVLANADLAKSTDDPELKSQLLDGIIEAARRAADLSNQMLEYSGKATLVREPLDLTAVVRDLAPMIVAVASKKARIRYDLGPDLSVEGDVTQLRQVVFNLILNGTDALDDHHGTVWVRARRDTRTETPSLLGEEPLPAGEYVCIEVSDDGSGMDPETAARMFDPFFTTKFTGRGLGLASVLGIVRAHGGGIEVATKLGEGTTCRVFLPACHRATKVKPEPSRAAAPIDPCVVLLVDDEPMVRRTMEILLRSDGHDALLAESGEVALRIFGDEHARIDLAIIDATMPSMGGVELIEALRKIAPTLPIILVSGYSETLASGSLAEQVGFLQKPYSIAQLQAAMADVLKP